MKIFSKLFLYYFLVGVMLLTIVIISLFKKNSLLDFFMKLLRVFIIFGFITHIGGLALRWYIAGHITLE